MNQEGLGLGRRGSEASRKEQFEDLTPDWERSSGFWYEELLISGLEWSPSPPPGRGNLTGRGWGEEEDKTSFYDTQAKTLNPRL